MKLHLTAAPHRLMFFAGALHVLLAMVWWTAWTIGVRWPALHTLPIPPMYAGWLHAFVMQYQMLPSFMFGFLLTTFPKWTKQPDVPRARFIPVGVALIAGQVATLGGALGSHAAIVLGVVLTLAGWTVAIATLAPMLWREEGTTWHARSCIAALVLGYAGIVVFGAYAADLVPMTWVPISIKLGTFGLLLPIFITVAHRMFPFFAGNIVVGYQPWRPLWLLAALWAGMLLHLALELAHAAGWAWLADAPLLALTAVTAWRWWPRGDKPRLLTVLFLATLWLPIAMALYTIDDVGIAITGGSLLGRAPAHALFIGFFGSALIAMVTRVTQGHSGRPLVMPPIAWYTFVAVQLVAITRILAERMPDAYAWLAVAAAGWLVAFVPWIVRLGAIYLAPRIDDKPG